MTRKTIRDLRLMRGLTQSELASRLGTSQSTVARWETGIHAPSYENLRTLGRTFQVPMRFILLTKGKVEDILPHAVIFCRIDAATNASSSDSLTSQVAVCRAYIQQQEYALIDVIHEIAPFDEPLWNRPQLQILRDHIVAEMLDIVVCCDLAVLASDTLELGLLYDEARNNSVQIETPSAGAEAIHKAGLDRFIAENAQSIYSLRKSIASIRGRRDRVRSGKPLASVMPLYGYRWQDDDKSRLAIDPATGPIVERIFEEADLGLTLRGIAKGLTVDGISTPSGRSRAWQGGSVHKILRNPAYMGQAYGWRSPHTEMRNVHSRRKGIRLPSTSIPAIVAEDVWESVQEQLRENWGRIHRLRRAGVKI